MHLIHQHYGILRDIHTLNFHPLCFQQCPRSTQGLVNQGLLAARIHHSPLCTPLAPYCSLVRRSWTGGGCRRADGVEHLSCSLSYHLSQHLHGCMGHGYTTCRELERHRNILRLVVVPTCRTLLVLLMQFSLYLTRCQHAQVTL